MSVDLRQPGTWRIRRGWRRIRETKGDATNRDGVLRQHGKQVAGGRIIYDPIIFLGARPLIVRAVVNLPAQPVNEPIIKNPSNIPRPRRFVVPRVKFSDWPAIDEPITSGN